MFYFMVYFSRVTYRINVTFVETDGTEEHLKVPVGTNMLEAAHSNDIELEGKHSLYLDIPFVLNFVWRR